jgi:uncharacterized protein involved in outer membrane biogenesis
MKKALLVIGVVILLLVLAVGIGAGFFLGDAVKVAVNKLGPKATQSNVVLGNATISPFTGTATLSGLTVGNPPGWSDKPAFSFGEVHANVAPGSFFKETIVINELVIDQADFNYETTLTSSNIKTLLANIEEYTGKAEETVAKDGKPRKFIVKKLRFTNGKATVVLGGSALAVPLPEIRLDDIGTAQGGISGTQVAAIVMRDVLTNIASATAAALSKDGGKATLEKAKETARQLGDSVKDLFKKKP